jgi:hypothetical protein
MNWDVALERLQEIGRFMQPDFRDCSRRRREKTSATSQE